LSSKTLLRTGDHGDAVRDLRARVGAALGRTLAVGAEFDAATEAAVREFQTRRGLRVDGICGPETWGALIESGFHLGDRLLYLAQPMVRGDDVTELQRRLNELGFDAGRADGILGPETEAALRAFQRNAGITADGVCGPATLHSLDRVGGLAAGSVATVRERDALQRVERRIEGERIFLAADPNLAVLADQVAKALRSNGAIVVLDTSGDDHSVLASQANRFEALVFVGLTSGAGAATRCAYFANQVVRSEGGFCLATRLTQALEKVFSPVNAPEGRTYRLLRETRMAAVVVEFGGAEDAAVTTALVTHMPDVARALVDGIRRGIEEPVDVSS
jgi:N-acetylmuramoyl-L-alanine amidase